MIVKQNINTIDQKCKTSVKDENLPLMITREELAEQLQVTTKTVDNLWRQGILPRPSRIGRAIRFMRSEIMAFLEKSRVQ
jgi:excisionase family DNA binding protein